MPSVVLYVREFEGLRGLSYDAIDSKVSRGELDVAVLPGLVAHDLVEHVVPPNGTIENELMALGVMLWGRGRYYWDSYVSPEESTGSEIAGILDHDSDYGTHEISIPKPPISKICGEASYMRDDLSRVTSRIPRYLEGDITPKQLRDIELWMAYGINKAKRRYGLSIWAASLFIAIENALKPFYETALSELDDGYQILLSYKIKHNSAKAKLIINPKFIY